MSSQSPNLVSVPSQSLAELEESLSRLWFTVNRVAVQMEQGSDVRRLIPVLREESNYALEKLHTWRSAKWASRGGACDLIEFRAEGT